MARRSTPRPAPAASGPWPIVRPLREDLEALERNGSMVLGGRIDHHNWSTRVWRPAREAVASSATPNSLRHTFASLLIAEGRTPDQVARLLGHSTPALTLSTYGHLFDEAQLGERESMEDAAIRARQRASASISRTTRDSRPAGGPGRRGGGAGSGGGERGRSSGRIR